VGQELLALGRRLAEIAAALDATAAPAAVTR
jgi:hypothetical protein